MGRSSITRRGAITLLGGVAGASVLPINFGCGLGTALQLPSGYVPTPEAPLTPPSDFYVNANFGQPTALPSPSSWRLHLRGMFAAERRHSLATLASFPRVTVETTLECVGNSPGGGLISSGAFGGVRLRDVLEDAGLDPQARGLHFVGLDGFASFQPVGAGLDPDALLADSLGGEPLDELHGAPLRVLFPQRYGMFSVKWLDSIHAIRSWHEYGALSGAADSVVDGTRPVKSRFDHPRDGRTVAVGETIEVTGLAVASAHGIARVEVRADGEWQPARITFNTLTDDRSRLLWSLWSFTWTPRAAGRQELAVRAVDTRGVTQDFDAEFPYDSGRIHTVRVVVRE